MDYGRGVTLRRRPNLINFFYLVGAGLLIQLAGTGYRIWLARRIGAEGLGILQMVYPIYRLLSGMATLGLPLALTKWVAEYLVNQDYLNINSLRDWAQRIVLVTSLIFAALLWASATFLSYTIFSDPRVYQALIIIAVAIPFSALSATYRGYFQGFSSMLPTAASELSEQAVEISTTFLAISFMLPLLPLATFSLPVMGLAWGEVACYLTLLFFLRRHRPDRSDPQPDPDFSRASILKYAWPLMLNQIVTSISMASEGVIIPHQLIAAGYSATNSTGLFGLLTGMAEPVAYFPLIFLTPLASVLSPQVSAAFKTNSLRQIQAKIGRFYLVASVICLISFGAILYHAAPLAQLLYRNRAAAHLIGLLTLGLPFTGILFLNIAILAAIGATDRILLLSLWALALKTCMIITLTPWLGINGAAWAFNITQIFLALASLDQLRQLWPQAVPSIRPRLRRLYHYLKPNH